MWFLLDVLRLVKLNLVRLDDDERAALGEDAERGLTCRGLAFGDPREARMAAYAQRLVENGPFTDLAEGFHAVDEEDDPDLPTLAAYQRMLSAFEPIWHARMSDYSMGRGDPNALSVDELRELHAVLSARSTDQ